LFSLEKKGLITLTIVSPENKKYITLEDIKKAVTDNTYIVIVNNISNVTGAVNSVEEIGTYLKDKDILFMVDGAQSAGHINIDMDKFGINILCVAGHKGLYGIAGSGAIIIDEKTQVSPTYLGGTGTETFNPSQPSGYPEKLEYGTLNLPAICSLDEGVRYIGNNLEFISNELTLATRYVIDKLDKINGVKVYSCKNPAGIVAFNIYNRSSIEVAEILSDDFNIAVRGGFHCAPLVHKFLKTNEEGIIRASISLNNTKRELNALIDAVRYITNF
jgi:selenocysteine lyase/cysteine desulfurase